MDKTVKVIIYKVRECPRCSPDIVTTVFGQHFECCPMCGSVMAESKRIEVVEDKIALAQSDQGSVK